MGRVVLRIIFPLGMLSSLQHTANYMRRIWRKVLDLSWRLYKPLT